MDLQDVRIVSLPGNSTSRSDLDAWLEESGIRPVFDASVADWDNVILLAELGLGCAIVPALPGWLRPGLRRPIPALPVLYAGWGRPALGALSPRARTFADTVSRNCAGNRPTSRSAFRRPDSTGQADVVGSSLRQLPLECADLYGKRRHAGAW
ncbi:LysR-family transcriptional regulator [Streptomyces sp. Mg1]|nr:LysR-family transcriptional regulator [Streptomyces sp. Mg1]